MRDVVTSVARLFWPGLVLGTEGTDTQARRHSLGQCPPSYPTEQDLNSSLSWGWGDSTAGSGSALLAAQPGSILYPLRYPWAHRK